MRCCVPFCNNTFDNESTTKTKGISFHGFPRDALLRAAWLRALGKQDSQLPECAVVCSQHFLDDEICETESGLSQIGISAVPSTVQVCMICLDTDSKLFPMTKHKLQEAYKKLTGHPLCDTGNLKQTICVQCAQRLINFNHFRHKILRARALMMDLVEKHELITRRHIKMINRTKHQLRSDFVVTTLGPDHYNLYILDSQEDKQMEAEADGNSVVEKNEENYDTMVNGDIDVVNKIGNGEFIAFNEENLSDNSLMLESKLMDDSLYKALEINRTFAEVVGTLDKIKCESAPLQSNLFYDESVENAIQNMHAQNGDGDNDCGTSLTENEIKQAIQKLNEGPNTSIDSKNAPVAPLSTRLATNNETEVQDKEVVAVHKRIQATEIKNDDLNYQSAESNILSNINGLTNCVVKLYDIFKKPKTKYYVRIQDELLAKTKTDISSFESLSHIDTASNYSPVISRNKHTILRIEDIGPVTNKLKVNNTYNLKTSQSETNNGSNISVSSFIFQKNLFTCDICGNMFQQKSLLVKHIRTHTDIKLFSCRFCKFKSKYESCLNRHTQTHTGEKPFSCKFCEYRCMQKNALIYHIRTHTGEKPYTCTLCYYKNARKDCLNRHMRTHTGEKPYVCELCEFKCSQKGHLKTHMRTHTDEKPYTCELCEFKCSRKSNLKAHMRTHTDDKPFSCTLCKYKCARNCQLTIHMRTHTGEKPFSCTLCKYKCAIRSHLTNHMRTHTGEKPFSCTLCKYKCALRRNLTTHMRTHTGEKPFSCTLCKYKCTISSQLTIHMRTHTGEKPFSCTLCKYKCTKSSQLTIHMRTHTGEKPFSCTLCKYKCTISSQLTIHMRTHTGEKPFSCTLCKYKGAQRNSIVSHMKTHLFTK